MLSWDPEKYTAAWNYAAHAHNNGKTVPGTDIPYINHIGNVAMEVMTAIVRSASFKKPDLAIQCALLHDVIEDTNETYESVYDNFGAEVADGVQALSKNKQLKTKEERMADSLERIKSQPHEVWIVKMADRITNFQRPPLYWVKVKINKYKNEALLIDNELKDADEYLSNRLKEKIDFYERYC